MQILKIFLKIDPFENKPRNHQKCLKTTWGPRREPGPIFMQILKKNKNFQNIFKNRSF